MRKFLLLMIFLIGNSWSFAQIIYDGSDSDLINGDSWYTFGNSTFSIAEPPLSLFTFNSKGSVDTYIGVGNARYNELGNEVSFGLTGDPELSTVEVIFSGSTSYPANFEIRLITLAKEIFVAKLSSNIALDYSNKKLTIPLMEFKSMKDNTSPDVADIEGFSNLTFLLGFYVEDKILAFSISSVEFKSPEPEKELFSNIIYNGTTSSLINGNTWYVFGNENFDIINHPLTFEKNDITLNELNYIGLGNSRYNEGNTLSLELYGKPEESHIDLILSGNSFYDSNLEIRFKTLSGEEFSSFIIVNEPMNFKDKNFNIPLSNFKSLKDDSEPTLQDIQSFSELVFVLGFYSIDDNISVSVSNVTFKSLTERCKPASKPELTSSILSACPGERVDFSIKSGVLNQAENWFWYKKSCGNGLAEEGSSFPDIIFQNTTYYVRGESNSPGCRTIGECSEITVTMKPPVIPEVEIILSPLEFCNKEYPNINTTTKFGGTHPFYSWSVNGAKTNQTSEIFYGGNFEDEFKTKLKTGDQIEVIMYSQDLCASPDSAFAKLTLPDCKDATGTTLINSTLEFRIKYIENIENNLIIHLSNPQKLNVASLLISNSSGVVLNKKDNINLLNDKIEISNITGNSGLILISLITEKEIHTEKFFLNH